MSCLESKAVERIEQKWNATVQNYCCPKCQGYAGQEGGEEGGHGTIDWFKIRNGVDRAIYCHPTYLTCAEYIKQNAVLESQAGIKIAGRNNNNLR